MKKFIFWFLFSFSSYTFSQITIIGNSCDSGTTDTCLVDAFSREREASARARETNARARQIELQNQNNAPQRATATSINPHPIDAARVLVNTFDICLSQASGAQFCSCYAEKMSKSVKVLDHVSAYARFMKGEKYNASGVISNAHKSSYAFCDQAVGFGK